MNDDKKKKYDADDTPYAYLTLQPGRRCERGTPGVPRHRDPRSGRRILPPAQRGGEAGSSEASSSYRTNAEFLLVHFSPNYGEDYLSIININR